jgi:ketosteroid isomerase-like protein
MQSVHALPPEEEPMGHEQAQTNLEVAFDWLNAMRRRDIDALAELFDPDLAWIDVAGNLACDGRDQALAWLRQTPNELNEVDAIELLANEEHVMFGVRNHTRHELAGVELEDGQSFNVLTLRAGKIVRLRGHAHRSDALADAGIDGYRWR